MVGRFSQMFDVRLEIEGWGPYSLENHKDCCGLGLGLGSGT